MKKEVIEKLAGEDKNNALVCPRCGGAMREEKVQNALSRYADVYICSACGTEEAFAGNKPFEEWHIWKSLMDGFDTKNGRKKFMDCVGEGLYSGRNSDNEEVIVCVGRGNGMLVKTVHESKPNWYEVAEYDEEGSLVSVSYEARK